MVAVRRPEPHQRFERRRRRLRRVPVLAGFRADTYVGFRRSRASVRSVPAGKPLVGNRRVDGPPRQIGQFKEQGPWTARRGIDRRLA